MKEVKTIQYARGFAAVMVVLHHLFSTRGLEYLFQPRLGQLGVDIFFVISGFIMWHTTAGTAVSPLVFWRRRIVRVVPLYWLFLSAMVGAALFAPQLFNTTVVTPENVLKSYLFIPHYHVVQKDIIAPILIPGWSLNYEMFFYLLFGLALFVESRVLRAAMMTAILLALVGAGALVQTTRAIALTYTSSELLKFLDGIILALLYGSRQPSKPVFGLCLVLVGLAVRLVGVSAAFDGFDNFVGLSPTLIVAGSLALEQTVRRAPNAFLHMVGDASYSIYLSHLFFLRATELGWRRFAGFGAKADDAVYCILALVVAIAAGIAVYQTVERPILRFFQKRGAPSPVELVGAKSV